MPRRRSRRVIVVTLLTAALLLGAVYLVQTGVLPFGAERVPLEALRAKGLLDDRGGLRVKLYYYNSARDRTIDPSYPCSADAVIPVERTIALSRTPIRDTIRLLIRGELTADERNAGFLPGFPHPDFKLERVSLRSGRLTMWFTPVPGFTTGGSCQQGILRAEVVKTAQQFPGVQEIQLEPRDSLFQP